MALNKLPYMEDELQIAKKIKKSIDDANHQLQEANEKLQKLKNIIDSLFNEPQFKSLPNYPYYKEIYLQLFNKQFEAKQTTSTKSKKQTKLPPQLLDLLPNPLLEKKPYSKKSEPSSPAPLPKFLEPSSPAPLPKFLEPTPPPPPLPKILETSPPKILETPPVPEDCLGYAKFNDKPYLVKKDGQILKEDGTQIGFIDDFGYLKSKELHINPFTDPHKISKFDHIIELFMINGDSYKLS